MGNRKGDIGEVHAAQYLSKRGYTIIERNWHTRYAEIDIVALYKDTLVVVEVKTRYSDSYGSPEEAMTPHKIRTLMRSAHKYALLHPELPEYIRIDFIGVEHRNGAIVRTNHIENITG